MFFSLSRRWVGWEHRLVKLLPNNASSLVYEHSHTYIFARIKYGRLNANPIALVYLIFFPPWISVWMGVSEKFIYLFIVLEIQTYMLLHRASDLNGKATKWYNSTQYGTRNIPVIFKHIHSHMHNETIILFTIVQVLLLLCLPFGERSF